MSQLDVTELLLDPLIAGQKFVVIRRLESVNQYGERSNSVQRFTVVGSVQPTGQSSLTREDAYQYEGKTIKVISRFKLRMAAKESSVNYDPDLVLWHGNYYVVTSIDDYSDFGEAGGMTVAEAKSIDYVDTAPRSPTPVL